VFVNILDNSKVVFDTMQYGKDNAIARHGIHGLYTLWSVNIDPTLLQVGQNTLFLRQRVASGPFTGVMYDYLRLESPAANNQLHFITDQSAARSPEIELIPE
jgi:rhamnogalacturonan endolyase